MILQGRARFLTFMAEARPLSYFTHRQDRWFEGIPDPNDAERRRSDEETGTFGGTPSRGSTALDPLPNPGDTVDVAGRLLEEHAHRIVRFVDVHTAAHHDDARLRRLEPDSR